MTTDCGAYPATRASAPSEEWRSVPIERYAGRYEVSDMGRVRSLHHATPKILTAKIDECGYREVCLCRDNKRQTVPIRKLVALAFHGEKRNVLHREIAHLDGSRTNDRADNLKWVSRIENRSHRKLHGTECDGERHPRAKLTDAQAAVIRATSGPRTWLAARYGISPALVSDIRAGRRYRNPERVSGL